MALILYESSFEKLSRIRDDTRSREGTSLLSSYPIYHFYECNFIPSCSNQNQLSTSTPINLKLCLWLTK